MFRRNLSGSVSELPWRISQNSGKAPTTYVIKQILRRSLFVLCHGLTARIGDVCNVATLVPKGNNVWGAYLESQLPAQPEAKTTLTNFATRHKNK